MRKKLFRLFAAILITIPLVVKADIEAHQELLVFLSAEGANTLFAPNANLKSPDGIVSADILYSFTMERFRFLGEYFASNKEAEFERLQIGGEVADNTLLWIGRFHAPSNYWTTEYHHGKYLQTSISTPAIVAFEDFGAALPTHSTGLLLDTSHVFEDSTGIKTAFSVGTASVLEDESLESLDLVNPESGHNMAFHFKFAYLPDYFKGNKVGIVALFADINAENLTTRGQSIGDIEQVSVGAFLDWYWENWHFISIVSHVRNRLKGTQRIIDDSFTSGFVQAEFEFDQNLTFFGRVEESASADDSRYLELLPQFVKSRQLLGAKFDFLEQHALSLEVANIDAVTESFVQVRLQWSAVFP